MGGSIRILHDDFDMVKSTREARAADFILLYILG
jgi:hypothetical protein